MKKLAILFGCFLTLSLTMSSFGKIDTVETSVVGKWKYYQERKTNSKTESLETYIHVDRCGKDYVEFFSDGKVNDVYYYGNDDCELSIDTGSWKKDDKNLTVSFPFAGEEKAEILILDETTLKLKAVVEGKEVIYVYKRM